MTIPATSSPVAQGRSARPAYEAARSGAAVLRRRGRRFLTVEGKGPREMLKGILSGRIPPPVRLEGEGWAGAEATYSAILTPKGKMVTDLRLIPNHGTGFLLDLPVAGFEGTLAHLGKYLNPRFAQVHDQSDALGMLTVAGPEAEEMVSRVLGFEIHSPGAGEVSFRSGGSGPDLWLLRNPEIAPPALDLILDVGVLEQVRGGLEEAGALPMDSSTWETLRIEAGTPLFGVDMTQDTIPVEAGIQDRAIDHGKGCYTGQEVVVRLRDRGRVNKSLRWVLLGDAEIPASGTELFPPPAAVVDQEDGPSDSPSGEILDSGGEIASVGGGKSVGWITSACHSPRFGQTIALAYLKRGVPPGAEVRLGGPLGGRAQVRDLNGEGGRSDPRP